MGLLKQQDYYLYFLHYMGLILYLINQTSKTLSFARFE